MNLKTLRKHCLELNANVFRRPVTTNSLYYFDIQLTVNNFSFLTTFIIFYQNQSLLKYLYSIKIQVKCIIF